MFLGYAKEEKVRLAKEIDRDGLPDILHVTELESKKTDDEIALIEETVRSVAICRKILGLESGPPMGQTNSTFWNRRSGLTMTP